MRVVWLADVQYKGFYSPSVATISVISSHLTEIASGKSLGGGLVFVSDEEDKFCDLELPLVESLRNPEGKIIPRDVSTALDPVVTEIGESDQIFWLYDATACSLSIGFSFDAITCWCQLGGEPIFLGLGADMMLVALVFSKIIEDPTGELESRWLDQIDPV